MIRHPGRGVLRTYHDQELSARRARRIAAHLAACARCRERLDEIATQAHEIRGLLEALEAESVPQVDALAQRRPRAALDHAPFGWRRWLLHPVALPAPALLALVLAVIGVVVTLELDERRVPAPPPPGERLVVVAHAGPEGREIRLMTVSAGDYRFIDAPQVHDVP